MFFAAALKSFPDPQDRIQPPNKGVRSKFDGFSFQIKDIERCHMEINAAIKQIGPTLQTLPSHRLHSTPNGGKGCDKKRKHDHQKEMGFAAVIHQNRRQRRRFWTYVTLCSGAFKQTTRQAPHSDEDTFLPSARYLLFQLHVVQQSLQAFGAINSTSTIPPLQGTVRSLGISAPT